MKKLFFSIMVLGALLLAGCQEEIGPVMQGGNVTFTLQTPDVATKTIGNGENVDIVYYEIYLNKADHKNNLNGKPLVDGTVPMDGKAATLSLNLLEDQEYVALFWAQVADKGHYDVTDLRSVKVNYPVVDDFKTVDANDESRAAFYKKYEFDTVNPQEYKVTLVRPFAQLNLGTTQESLTIDYPKVLEESQVAVAGVATEFNVAEEKASNASEDVLYAYAAVPMEPLTVNDVTYAYAGMNYFLVPDDEGTVNIVYDIKTDVGTVNRAVPSVPVKKNYRTNIIGNLLTKETVIEIVVDEKFADSADMYEGGKYGVLDGKRYVKVESVEEFNAAFTNANIDMIILLNDMVLTESVETKAASDPTLTIRAGTELILDLNGKKLSATSSQTGKNYNMFDVRGTLTVKNGTLEYEHKGENMGWNNSTNIFNVTAGGVLNLEGVTAKNLGGSDMGFVAHLNNWGEVTLNVDNCTLESNYVAVRVFNSGNDMNNVTIKNSTLKGGSYAFWVHNYTVEDFGSQEKADAHKSLLNFDILNGTNVFEGNNSTPIRYGFTNSLYFDANGVQQVNTADALATLLKEDKENIAVSLGADIDLPITSLGQQTGGSGEYKLGGENTKSITIDLNGKKLNITTTYWSAIGAKNADALFIIKNGTMTSTGNSAGTWNAWDLRFSNCNYAFEGVNFEKAVALDNAGKATSMKKVTITDTHNTDTYGLWITAEGQTVTLEDCVIDMTPASDGRGIKIDEQYVGDADKKKVTLNVTNVTFKTEEKAAILVKSVEGAEINASNLDITAVAADQTFAVWVDSDAATYADKVVVNGALVKVEGTATVETADNLIEALENGKDVVLVNDVKIDPAGMSNAYGTTGINVKNGQTIDGGGHTLDIQGAGGTWDSGISTTGGLIKNITITGSFRGVFINHNSTHSEEVVLDNVIIDGTTYTISCDQGTNKGFEATNSTFKGWTSYAATLGNAKFTDCHFGEGSGYAYCRPYAPTEFVGCDFEAGFEMDARAAVTFENCTIGGVALTAENLATLVTSNIANATVK